MFFPDNLNRVREVVAATGIIQTVAGNGTGGYSGDGGLATSAELSDPSGIFVDQAGNIFIADFSNYRIREVVAATGIIQTVAGTGVYGFSGDTGLATAAELSSPFNVFVDGLGNLFIADSGNHRIREVVKATGIIQTVAGNGTGGYSGDGGPATSAELWGPGDIFVDGAGNIFISDSLNDRVREVLATTGIIQTVAGNGYGYSGDGGPATSAEFTLLTGIFLDKNGNIFIADSTNNRIREVDATTGIVHTVAGNGEYSYSGDGGPATKATLLPLNVSVDAAGNIFIADAGNSRVREVFAATGIIQTVAGNGTQGLGDGGPATDAGFNGIEGISVDGLGNLFIADSDNQRIREVATATGIIQTVANLSVIPTAGEVPHGVFADVFGNIFFTTFNPCSSPDSCMPPPTYSRVLELMPSTGLIRTVAGTATPGYSGDGGPATNAGLYKPNAVAVDGLGNIFIADTLNNCIREVIVATGIIQTVAGNGSFGFSGDGSPATSAQLNGPSSVVVDLIGNIFIADYDNSRIREVVAATGIIQTVAGNDGSFTGDLGDGGPATSASLFGPTGMAGDPSGNLLIVDSGNRRIRSVSHLLTVFPDADFSLSVPSSGNCPSGGNCSTWATISAGQTATYNLQASQVGGFLGIVSLTCSGAPNGSTCSISPSTISVSASSGYGFTVTVSSASKVHVVRSPEFPLTPTLRARRIVVPLLYAILITLLSSKGLRNGRMILDRPVGFASLAIAVMIFSGCSSGNGTSSNLQHPSSLTIIGTSARITHQLSLSLTVN